LKNVVRTRFESVGITRVTAFPAHRHAVRSYTRAYSRRWHFMDRTRHDELRVCAATGFTSVDTTENPVPRCIYTYVVWCADFARSYGLAVTGISMGPVFRTTRWVRLYDHRFVYRRQNPKPRSTIEIDRPEMINQRLSTFLTLRTIRRIFD